MWSLFKPTRFKLSTTLILVILIWLVSRLTLWVAPKVILVLYPTYVDFLKELFTPNFTKLSQELRKEEFRHISLLLSATRFAITVCVSYLGACLIARLAVHRGQNSQSNQSLQTDR
jgi:hypothetical protein